MSELAGLPAAFARSDLEAVGFEGWRTWEQLGKSGFSEVPEGPAAYVVYRPANTAPVYLDSNPGGWFKQQDPSVERGVLGLNWVPECQVVYVGKANNARRRLAQYGRFGRGEPVGHWGGRYIWQLADSTDLLVAWHLVTWEETPRDYECRLLGLFASLHGGARPFANLTT